MNMSITERIACLMRFNAITQRDICRALDILPSTFNELFANPSDNIPFRYILPLCKLFEITTDELLTGSPSASMYLNPNERRLAEIYRELDYDSQSIVMSAAVNEKRRMGEPCNV